MIGKLLCVMAFACAALAQRISIISPAAGTKVTAGSTMLVQLERTASSTATNDVSLVIAAGPCFGGCSSDGLGHSLLYSGPFSPQSTNSAGAAFQNITATVPNYFNGVMQLSVAHFCLVGLYNSAELQLTNTTLFVTGGGG